MIDRDRIYDQLDEIDRYKDQVGLVVIEEVREVRDHEDDEELCVSTTLLVGGILVLQGGSCRMKQQVLEMNRNDGIYEWTQTGRRRGRNRVQAALHVCVDRVYI